MSNQKKVFLILLMAASLAFLWLIKVFFTTIVLSVIIVVFFNPIYKKLLFWTKGNSDVSSLITILCAFFMFLSPLIILLGLIIGQINQVANDLKSFDIDAGDIGFLTDSYIATINNYLASYSIDYTVTKSQLADYISSVMRNVGFTIFDWLKNFGTNIPELITHFILLILLTHFFFVYQNQIYTFFKKVIPIPTDVVEMYVQKVFSITRSMIKGTFVIAFVQGLLGGTILFFVGTPYIFFWFIVITVAAIIPFIGTGIILVPIALFMIVTGEVLKGLIILSFQILVISNIDNLLRPKLVEKNVKMPEALILLGVISGIYTFGPIGLVLGPVITVLVKTTYDVYMSRYAYSIKALLTSDRS